MKLIDYNKWYWVCFYSNRCKQDYEIWTRDKDLWENSALREQMKLDGYASVFCSTILHGIWNASDEPFQRADL